MNDLMSYFCAGFLSASFSTLLFYPLEGWEARVQVLREGKRSAAQLWRSEGFVRGFMRGWLPSTVGTGVSWGLYLLIFEIFRHTEVAGKSFHTDFFLRAAIGAMCTLITNPFAVVKFEMVVHPTLSTSAALSSIMHKHGFVGLYAGVLSSLCGISEGAVQMPIYGRMKSIAGPLAAGAVSRTVSVLVTYPYQALRSTQMAHQKPFFETVQALSSEGILSGFYSGIWQSLMRCVPPSAFMFVLMENIRRILTSG